MSKILGTTVSTPMPRSNYNQTDPSKADYIIGRENILNRSELDSIKDDIVADVINALPTWEGGSY